MDKVTLPNFFTRFPSSTFSEGDILLPAHQDPTGILYLAEGFVREYTITIAGEELTLHFFKPGSFFPLTWGLNAQPNRYFYEAHTQVTCHLAPKDQVEAFLKDHPDELLNLTKRLLYGLDGLLLRIESLATQNAETRVLGILLFLKKHFGSTLTSFTHQDIAHLTGLTRETTSRELEKLQKLGKIRMSKHAISILI